MGHERRAALYSWDEPLSRKCLRLSRPICPVQRAVAHRFRHVRWTDVFAAFEIRNGAADFQDAIVGAGGEAETLHRALEHLFALRVDLAVHADHARCHAGVAENAFATKTI